MCVGTQAGSGSPTMAAAVQDFQRSESDRLNEVKGHLEIALLEKHFLREYAHTDIYTYTYRDIFRQFLVEIHVAKHLLHFQLLYYSSGASLERLCV